MRFISAETNDVFNVFRCISTDGGWEIGCRKMMFGVRVGLSKIGNRWYTLDYCSGDNAPFTLELLATIAKILERYPENVSEAQITQDFPGFEIKPIDKDPCCWQRLQEMAAISPAGGDRS